MKYAPIPILGVSLGRRHQRTGVAVVERHYVPTGEVFNSVTSQGSGWGSNFEVRENVTVQFHVRLLERQGPPSRYSKVAQRLPEIVSEIGTDGLLTVDITAAGRPAYSLILGELAHTLKGRNMRWHQCPVTVSGIAGGVSKSPDVGYLVPRRDLISSLQILFDQGQLKIAEGLELAATLKRELVEFEEKAKKSTDDLDAWRVGSDDDLVLSVATAVWVAERFLAKKKSRPVDSLILNPMLR